MHNAFPDTRAFNFAWDSDLDLGAPMGATCGTFPRADISARGKASLERHSAERHTGTTARHSVIATTHTRGCELQVSILMKTGSPLLQSFTQHSVDRLPSKFVDVIPQLRLKSKRVFPGGALRKVLVTRARIPHERTGSQAMFEGEFLADLCSCMGRYNFFHIAFTVHCAAVYQFIRRHQTAWTGFKALHAIAPGMAMAQSHRIRGTFRTYICGHK